MIKYCRWICAAIITSFFCLYPLNARAVPKEVIIYPDSAQVVEESKVHLNHVGKDLQTAVFFLPGQADPNSLVTRLLKDTGVRIEDQTWRQVVRYDDEKIKKLRKQAQLLKSERNSIQAAISSLETQVQFWQMQTKSKTKTLSESFNIVSAIGKNIQKAYHDKLSCEQELDTINKQIKEVTDELNRTGEKKETLWEITLLVSASKTHEALLTYGYLLSGCGWKPAYRIDARPREKRILFSWEADIWQDSGQDWNEVDLSISTSQPVRSDALPDLTPWIINPLSATSALQKKGKSNITFLHLGKNNLPTGLRQRLSIEEDEWTADFIHLIRPTLSSQSFVKALVNFPEPIEILEGEAIFMIDGAYLKKQVFSYSGQEGVFFFGIDPLVNAYSLITKKSAGKMFYENMQAVIRDIRIDIQNTGKIPAKVLIEYPYPQAGDENIKLAFQHNTPVSEQDRKTLTWKFDIAAGQKKSIFTTINITAPADMKMDLGCK